MQALYAFCSTTKQAYHQALKREREWVDKEGLILGLIMQIRELHPAMGLRTMYEFYQPQEVGRDAFLQIGLRYGFRVKTFKNESRTTFSTPYNRFKNLLVSKILNNTDQLWTSDLTYFKVAEKFFYIVFIMDVYSRKILGFSVADNMRAENNCKALRMAFKSRGKKSFVNLIHHSDRGGQYVSDAYIDLLEGAGVKISMCNDVHENAHVERVNGTIKNQYLAHWNITTFEQLTLFLKRAVDTYNSKRPHSALNGLPPVNFEAKIAATDAAKRPKMSIWTCDMSKDANPNQCLIQF